jgi:hypothetical protein
MALKLLGSLESSGGDLQVLGTIKASTHGDGFVIGSPTTVKFKLGVYGANDLLFKDPSNNVLMTLTSAGKLGIGATSPDTKLHLVDSSDVYITLESTSADTTEEVAVKYSNSATGSNYWWEGLNQSANWSLGYGTSFSGSTTRLLVNTSGNVGIGTTAPLEKLHVAGKINSSNNIVSNSTYTMFTGRSSRTVDDYGGLNKQYFKANLVTPGPNTTGESSAHGIADLRFQLANSAGNTNMSDIMTLRSGGNVGIGTSTPNEKLTVAGNIHAYAPSGINAGLFASTAAGATSIAIRSSGVTFFNAGNVGIGTTTPQRVLDVNLGGNSGVGASFAGTISAGEYQGIHFGYSEAGNGNYRHSAIVFERDDATHGDARGKIHILNSASGSASADLGDSRLTVLPSGNVGIGTTAPSRKLHVSAGNGDTAAKFENTSSNGTVLHLQTTGDNKSMYFQTDHIYVSSGAMHFGNNTGDLYLRPSASGKVGIGTTNPTQKLHVAGSQVRLDTAGGGYYLHNTSGTFRGAFHDNGTVTSIYADGNGSTAAISIDSGNSTFAGDVSLVDSKKLILGTGSDLKIYHNSTDSVIENSTGDLYITNKADDKDIVFRTDDGSGGYATYFRIDGSEVENTFLKNTRHFDNVKALFGDSGDLQIFHDGSNSYISDTGTGSMYFNGADNMHFQVYATGERWITLTKDAGVDLFYNDSKKFETTNTGVTVTGNLVASNDITASGDLSVRNITASGNLIVNGTTTTLNTQTVEVEDNILQLNTTQGTPDTATAATSGISVYRGDGVTQASLIFDDADDTWDLTNNLAVAGNVLPQFNGGSNLGSGSKQWGSIYAGGIAVGTVTPTTIHLNGSFNILNKAQTAYIGFATRNTSGSQTVMDLTNVGSATFAGNVTLSSTAPILYLANTTSSTGKTWRFSSAANGNAYITQDGVIDAITLSHTSGKATFAGRVSHTGLEPTSGFGIDQIREFPMTFQLTANTWTDTGIDGTDLTTGTYAMQVYVSDFEVGGHHYYEYYSATITWYGGSTNSTAVDEIPVHRAGHATNTGDLQFRTQRASGSDSHDLMLQVKHNKSYTGALDNDHGGKIMRFKFRRLM